jgi:hypothetical protein
MPFVNNSLKRLSTESIDDYHKRLALVRKVEKIWLRGRVIWNSKEKGTVRVK